jgi:hypothetical protein
MMDQYNIRVQSVLGISAFFTGISTIRGMKTTNSFSQFSTLFNLTGTMLILFFLLKINSNGGLPICPSDYSTWVDLFWAFDLLYFIVQVIVFFISYTYDSEVKMKMKDIELTISEKEIIDIKTEAIKHSVYVGILLVFFAMCISMLYIVPMNTLEINC